MWSLMPRPRVINPKGRTRRISVFVAEPVAEKLEREAKRRGTSLGAVVRERLGAA